MRHEDENWYMTNEVPPAVVTDPDAIHISLDLETLSCWLDATIIEIGAVSWQGDLDPDDPISPSHKFEALVDPNSEGQGSIHTDTVDWHLRVKTRWGSHDSLHPDYRTTLKDALTSLLAWARAQRYVAKAPDAPVFWWVKGAEYDIPILRDALVRCGLTDDASPMTSTILHRRRILDVRTLTALVPEALGFLPEEAVHGALADARSQGLAVAHGLGMLKALRLG